MYLVDTCGWIEWLTNGKLVKIFEKYLENTSELIVPSIIQYELYKWICRERDEQTALNIISVTEQSKVIAIDSHLALTAADIAQQYKLAMADALIYACASINNVELVTCDSHFEKLPNVQFYSKSQTSQT